MTGGVAGSGAGCCCACWAMPSLGCSSATLEVRPSNTAAVALYSSHGFVEIGRRKGYYAAEGEDAIVMHLEIDRQTWKTIASAGGAGV